MLRPILITGSHRSGTTWVGKVINSSNTVNYLHEPLKPGTIYREFCFNDKYKKVWFLNISYVDDKSFKLGFEKILSKGIRISDIKCNNLREIKDSLKLIRDINFNKKRRLLKDPISIFSSEWIYENYNSKNIILIRNPYSFVSSLIKNNWSFDFNNLLKQDNLLNTELNSYKELIIQFSREEKPIIEQAVLLWNILYSFIDRLRSKYNDWYFVTHEDLCDKPIVEFERIFNFLDIKFSKNVREYIINSSSKNNPTERADRNVHVLNRNSKDLSEIFKKRLTEEQISYIKNKTHHVRIKFYEN